jgi:hypothetical protein
MIADICLPLRYLIVRYWLLPFPALGLLLMQPQIPAQLFCEAAIIPVLSVDLWRRTGCFSD